MRRLNSLLINQREQIIQLAGQLAANTLFAEAMPEQAEQHQCFHCVADMLCLLLESSWRDSDNQAMSMEVPDEVAVALDVHLQRRSLGTIAGENFAPLLLVKTFRTACIHLLTKTDAEIQEFRELYQAVDLLELALLQHQRKYRHVTRWAATDHLPQPALVLTPDCTIWHVNQLAEQVLGVDRRNVVGQPSELVFPWLAEALDALRRQEQVDVTQIVPTTEGDRYSAIRLSRIKESDDVETGVIILLHDLSERHQHESELWMSENKFRQLFDNLASGMLVGIAISDGEEFVITDINRAAERIEGITRQHAIGRTMGSLLPVRADAGFQEALRRVWITGESEQLTLQPTPGNNSPRHIRLFRLPQGELVVAYDDLAAYQETARRLDRTRQRMSDIIEFLPDATMAINLQGQVTIWNRAMEQITGYPKEEMLGKGNQAYSVPFHGQPSKGLLDLMLEQDQSSLEHHGIYHTLRRDGDSLYARGWAPCLNGGNGSHVTSKVSLLRNMEGKVIGAIQSVRDVNDLHQALEQAEAERERLAVTLSSIGDGVLVTDNRRQVLMLNTVAEELTGWTTQDAFGRSMEEVFNIVNEYTGAPVHSPVDVALQEGKIVGLANHTALVSRQGSTTSIADSAAPIRNSQGEIIGAVLVFRDVSEERERNQALRTSEARLRHITNNLLDIVCEVDPAGVLRFVSPSFQTVLGHPPTEVIGKSALEFLHPDDRRQATEALDLETLRENDRIELRCRHANGQYLWVELAANLIVNDDGKFSGVILAGREITARRNLEQRLRFLSWHDGLTGVFNRAYFEERLRQLDQEQAAHVGMLFCDVDGLKLINDTMGHEAGDHALQTLVQIISQSCPAQAVVSRIGGDEIAVLLPRTSRSDIEGICSSIAERVEIYNADSRSFPLSISVGFADSGADYVPMQSLFKEADDNMYRVKLHRSQSTRSAVVTTLMRALEARDFITEGHADRIQRVVQQVGQTLQLSEHEISDLKLLAQFHDIGKVGTPDRILFKPGPLTKEEAMEMRRHCEIGHRIAQSAPDLIPIADLILKHHEWWNGEGYPLGLRGESIPLACRILAIADAYDAMTSNRPYRKALAPETAISELERKAGSQFDPDMVSWFIQSLDGLPLDDQVHQQS